MKLFNSVPRVKGGFWCHHFLLFPGYGKKALIILIVAVVIRPKFQQTFTGVSCPIRVLLKNVLGPVSPFVYY